MPSITYMIVDVHHLQRICSSYAHRAVGFISMAFIALNASCCQLAQMVIIVSLYIKTSFDSKDPPYLNSIAAVSTSVLTVRIT
ncbi:hypothetical protein L195_g025130 [Trifolium pratense]|uniref:Uncharacterized protein n=1 Tax=Trifolium pratense TaxID=57577 RepID=A0A2K3NFM0_TRIPR|nr:hypothetical protein L195_g025130 [Trifolium pratense]